jgi:quercetin dioxygenase-like cupin family protein
MSASPIIRRPGEAGGVTLGGQPMGFLVTGASTKYTSMFDWTIPPGFSTGEHVHRVQEETFYVLEGNCDWWVNGERIQAPAGTFLFVPPGARHNITNMSDNSARVLMTVSPPGHERYFVELAKMTAEGRPDGNAVGQLRRRYDTDQLSTLSGAS